MNWYYVDGGRQAGPVDEAGLAALVANGQIQPETLVWREGMANWQPYREVMAATGPGAPAAAQAVCAECGGLFSIQDTIQVGSARVCANCKPVFVQRMREGAPQGFLGGTNATEEQILAREYRVDFGGAFSRGWAIFTANVGVMVGTFLLAAMVLLVFSIIGAVLGKIVPFLNSLLSVFYTIPLMTGLSWMSLRLVRGEAAGVGDGFAGFGVHYVRLLGYAFLLFALNVICALPIAIVLIVYGVSIPAIGRGQAFTNPSPEMLAAVAGGGFVTFCCLCYIGTIFYFVPLLIMDKGYGLGPAMRLSWKAASRRWWMTFWFLLAGGLFGMLGVFLCCVGWLVTWPVYMNMKSVLYDENFRDLAAQK